VVVAPELADAGADSWLGGLKNRRSCSRTLRRLEGAGELPGAASPTGSSSWFGTFEATSAITRGADTQKPS
jgi:hypothetical protein